MNIRGLGVALAVAGIASFVVTSSAGAATPKGHLPFAFNATCEGLGDVAVVGPPGNTSWMIDGHWLITSLSQTFVPDDGSEPTLLFEETAGRKTGLGEPISCTAEFPADGGIVFAVATVVPVPPQ